MTTKKNHTPGKPTASQLAALMEEETPDLTMAQAKVASDLPKHVITIPDSIIKEPSMVSPEHRQHMIQEAAYFRAEGRGFSGGDAAQDWAEAEAEIDRMLENPPSR